MVFPLVLPVMLEVLLAPLAHVLSLVFGSVHVSLEQFQLLYPFLLFPLGDPVKAVYGYSPVLFANLES